jgi:SNF2 family DNA or RNA helicase
MCLIIQVLIFSQMTQMMDILEDYCIFRGHTYCRLDGRMKMSDRQNEVISCRC